MSKPIIALALISALGLAATGKAVAEGETPTSLVVSATRSALPQEQVASDITVITKEDISHLAVHDAGEALNYVTGLEFDRNGGQSGYGTAYIQGANPRYVKVLIDDVPLELLTQSSTDLSTIPIENIERIEVLKGSASSVWGSALGGVINIITRTPTDERVTDVGVSQGERHTNKYHAVWSGKVNGTGYFLSAAKSETDGFHKNQEAQDESIYGKITRDLTDKLKLVASYNNNRLERGDGEYDTLGFLQDSQFSDTYGRIALEFSPSRDYELSVAFYDRYLRYNLDYTLIGDAAPFSTSATRERTDGGVLKTVWRHSTNGTLAAGGEASRQNLDLHTQDAQYDNDKGAVYLNESYVMGNLGVTAGARYDDDRAFGSEISPSLGLTYNISPVSTILRLNAARGFTPPPLDWRYATPVKNTDLSAERAWTYQAGFETKVVPGLWGKFTYFRADISDQVVSAGSDDTDIDGDGDTWEAVYYKNLNDSRREGYEVEVRTSEFAGLTLSYGYANSKETDLETDTVLKDRPRITQNVGVDYRGPFETVASLRGHYVWWNPDKNDGMYGTYYTTKDKSFIWDAKVTKYFAKWKGVIGEVFASVHNLTDEEQFRYSLYPNPGRWVEGGVSLSFY